MKTYMTKDEIRQGREQENTTRTQCKSDISVLLDILTTEAADTDCVGDLMEVRRKLVELTSFVSGHTEETVLKHCESMR